MHTLDSSNLGLYYTKRVQSGDRLLVYQGSLISVAIFFPYGINSRFKIFHSIDILPGPVNTKDTDSAIKSSGIESKPNS